MGADLEQLLQALAVPWRQEWIQKALSCWPGAVTLVLPIRGTFTDFLHPGGETLGLRVPACGMTQALMRSTGPLATTSANLSGRASATTAAAASRFFPELPLLGPLPWPGGSGRASQVLTWEEGSEDWRILRSGAPADGRSPAA
jgi:L-threonylcarbamoyladenylate synthase